MCKQQHYSATVEVSIGEMVWVKGSLGLVLSLDILNRSITLLLNALVLQIDSTGHLSGGAWYHHIIKLRVVEVAHFLSLLETPLWLLLSDKPWRRGLSRRAHLLGSTKAWCCYSNMALACYITFILVFSWTVWYCMTLITGEMNMVHLDDWYTGYGGLK